MSGKPASVGACGAAGVAGAGSPRVLVYVADRPRQLEPGAAPPDPQPPDLLYLPDNLQQLPRNSIYRPQIERNDLRNSSGGIYYKAINDANGKIGVYGTSDNPGHQTEYLSLSQQFVKDPCLKGDDKPSDRTSGVNVKRDSTEQLCVDLNNADTFQSKISAEAAELLTYQSRGHVSVGVDGVMPVHSFALHHGQTQFNDNLIQSGEIVNNSEDVSIGRSYVNYQLLEQSVSHQSIVNQSISILNQQVGVSRVVNESDSGNGAQLVRTADGVVLAVLPSSVLPQAVDTEPKSIQSDSPQTIVVPLGWRRIVNATSVLYISPSGTALSALPQLREYLQTAGTCKCGLPCPLRPETAFSFDPKVISKPYQPASGAELTKLCNHKRKLLATLQARAQSPATPPPSQTEQKKVAGGEVAVLKKKMKKRPGFPPNMSVSPLLMQRDGPFNELKSQDVDHNRTVSPGVGPQRNIQPGMPFTMQQTLPNTSQDDVKHEAQVQRSSHYITVNSGWITQQQQESLDRQKCQTPSIPNTPPLNVGMPVLGTNGQIIGVNTGFNKQNANFKNVNVIPQNQDHKDEKKEVNHQNNPTKYSVKQEESQIFCGLNQPLTPEVMQKINEQQQIFIQQNQKQIELAMKGFRTQLADNTTQNRPSNQTPFVPQGQLVIQNGAVVKTNPAKTPPWQVKRNDPIASPSPKSQKLDNADYEEANTNISDDSTSSYGSFSSNEHMMNQCPRVPPLPQHYNMINQQWPVADVNKKKVKNNNKGSKKKVGATDGKVMNFGNNGMRIMQEPKADDIANSNVPSFMDDPSGYLAQQTALLNNTINRQVGMNSNLDGNRFDNNCNNCFNPQGQIDKSGKPPTKSEMNYRSNLVPNPSPSPNTTPDSSVLLEKTIENPPPRCYKGQMPIKGSPDFADNQMRLKYMKHTMYKGDLEGNISSPKHGFEDNPVTSSTFIERSPVVNENCGPIQAGTVSTSNVSPTETLLPPEPSPTLSNSSRNTDTPHSNGSGSSQMSNCTFPIPSPAYSNSSSFRENFNSNPPTPGSNQAYHYNSPGPPNNPSITGTQMMHFISNHNVNKNLMEVDNISMVGVKPGLRAPQEVFRADRRRMENTMPGYCPPPHLGGGPAHSLIQACYVQTFVTTMASGFSVTRDTMTSVLAGKANTATTSINASQANFVRPPPPPSVNLATTYAIPNNQPDPFINSVNLPTSYPLHIAGTTAQNMISKSPLEMVQNVIGSLPSKLDANNSQHPAQTPVRRAMSTTPGQILISSTGQIIVSNNQMPPPPPKTTTVVSPGHSSSIVTNVTTSITQGVPGVGNVQPIVNQPTVVVNTLPTPFVFQPPMMAVDGQVVQQNAVLPQIVAGGIMPGQSPSESPRPMDVKSGQNYVQGVAMLSPESLKKRNKKKKNQLPNITNVLQIAAPSQNPNNLMVHHTSPQHNTSSQFSPRGFQLSPNNNISPTPVLQALTIVPGKSGTPAHIVMNGQGNTNNFGSQQIITNTSPSQQINLLQPVNLINNASSVMQNFPFQQFIVPNLGGMVMTADGTAIIQDNSTGMPVQLQLQTVNGQNVLTPVQNSGVFTAGANSGVVLRAQNQQGKIIQSQHSPGAQFLSPNSQVMMNSPGFNGQLSPLLANLSPTNVAFNASSQVRSSNVQAQEFIQTNQMGQTLMVPLSPKQVSIAATRSNSTFVQQNTTIVQQQTTLVSNAPSAQLSSNLQGNSSRMIDPNALLAQKQAKRNYMEQEVDEAKDEKLDESKAGEFPQGYVRHSVSTQTFGQRKSPGLAAGVGCSPPDTTTLSPLGPLDPQLGPPEPALGPLDPPPAPPAARVPRCPQPHYADTTTRSPEPDTNCSAMVQCVSSSEQDMAESREQVWPATRNEFNPDTETQGMMSNASLMRQSRAHNPVESTEMHYNQNMNATAMNNQHIMPVSSNYYDRTQGYKRKNEFGDGSSYRTDKIMRTNYSMVHGLPKDSEYDMGITSADKIQPRHFPSSGSSSRDNPPIQKVFDRHNLGSGDDGGAPGRQFAVGDVVWAAAGGHGMWPARVERCGGRGGRGVRVRWFRAPPAAPARAHLAPRLLLTLSEGLEAHHAARTKLRKSRKLNTLLENAIQEAMAELDKKSEKTTENVDNAEASVSVASIAETPKRSRKHDKKGKEKSKKSTNKGSKSADSTRLRSSR